MAREATHAREEWQKRANEIWQEMQDTLNALNSGQGGLSPKLVAAFREAMSSVLESMLSAMGSDTPAGVDAQIRSVLEIVMLFVAGHDQSTRLPGAQRPLFSASIFLARLAPFSKATEATMAEALRFAPSGTRMADLRGILELRQEWSVSMARRAENGGDGRVTPLRLPILIANELDPLPGAVAAWLTGSLDVVGDVRSIYHGKFATDLRTADLAEETRKLFDSDSANHVRSFLSIAIADPRDLAGPCLGTINVNCNLVGLLSDDRQSELIAPYLQTLTFVLPAMVDRAKRVAQPAPSPPRRGRRSSAATGRKRSKPTDS